jgi:ABC-type sugar transport system ATPase subunit
MIRANQITLHIGGFQLNRLSLEVNPNEYFVLLGPPGSGKTLFLEVLCGLRRPQSGQIFINRQNVIRLEPRRRMIGYVPQDYALFPHLNVEGNIRFGLEAGGLSESWVNERVQKVADQLGIRRLLSRQIAGLSGGERQQVALGRALVIRPKVLLLDEPVSALDESTREAICSELKRVQRELSLATIHVCHQLQEAFSVADRAGILRDGSFQQIGTLDELIHRPANAFVARFMRCQNILSGLVLGIADHDGWTEIKVAAHQFAVPGRFHGEIQLVIRPERIRLAHEGFAPCDSSIQFPAEIQRVLDRGSHLQIEIDASFPLTIYATHEELANLVLDPGTKVTALIRPESIHILSSTNSGKSTGQLS